MAEADIDAIIATADDNTTWGDSMRGAFSTVKAAVTQRHIKDETIGSGRLNADGRHYLTMGPFSIWGNTLAQAAGSYIMGLSMVRGGTPTTVTLRVMTGAATSDVYYVMYDMADDGHPTNLAYSWGPFDATAAATVSLTGQTTAIAAGMYWCGTFAPTGNGGNPVMYGGRPGFGGVMRTGNEGNPTLRFVYADATPRSTFTATMRTNSVYEADASNITIFSGKA